MQLRHKSEIVSSFQFPVDGSNNLSKATNWKLETGNWKLLIIGSAQFIFVMKAITKRGAHEIDENCQA
jgi:hypothetical protein